MKLPPIGPQFPWLAPLAGYSDLPFRALCREYGAAVCVTEMVSAKGLFYGNPGSTRLLQTDPADAPLVVQIFGSEPEIMAYATRRLRKTGFHYVDCNMGCSVRKVMRQGAGAALLASPERASEVARAVLRAAAEPLDDAPPAAVGFKLRLGVTPDKTVARELSLRLEDAGASWLCLHPRYAVQGFSGDADRSQIADLVPRLSIPLLASGDLFDAASGVRLLAETGAAGVAYARGALKDPSVFAKHRAVLEGAKPSPPNSEDLLKLAKRHVELARLHDEGRGFVRIRSLLPRYAKNCVGVGELRRALCACASWDEIYAALDSWESSRVSPGV